MNKKAWQETMERFLEMWIETLEHQAEAWRKALSMTKQYGDSWKKWLGDSSPKNFVTEQALEMAERFEDAVENILEMVNHYEDMGKKLLEQFKEQFGTAKSKKS